MCIEACVVFLEMLVNVTDRQQPSARNNMRRFILKMNTSFHTAEGILLIVDDIQRMHYTL